MTEFGILQSSNPFFEYFKSFHYCFFRLWPLGPGLIDLLHNAWDMNYSSIIKNQYMILPFREAIDHLDKEEKFVAWCLCSDCDTRRLLIGCIRWLTSCIESFQLTVLLQKLFQTVKLLEFLWLVLMLFKVTWTELHDELFNYFPKKICFILNFASLTHGS